MRSHRHEENTMPKVGKKHFPYTPAGEKAAEEAKKKQKARRPKSRGKK